MKKVFLRSIKKELDNEDNKKRYLMEHYSRIYNIFTEKELDYLLNNEESVIIDSIDKLDKVVSRFLRELVYSEESRVTDKLLSKEDFYIQFPNIESTSMYIFLLMEQEKEIKLSEDECLKFISNKIKEESDYLK